MFTENNTKRNNRVSRRASFKAGNPSILICSAVVLIIMLALVSVKTAPTVNAEPEGETASKSTDKLALEIVEIDSAIKDLDRRISELRTRSESLDDEISGAKENIEVKREEASEGKDRFNSRVRELYINGRNSTLEAFLTSEDFDEFMVQRDYAEMVADNDSKLLKEVKRETEELDRAVAELERKKAEADSLMDKLETERADLQNRKDERESVLAAAGTKRDAVEQKSSEAESRIVEINPGDSEPPPPGKEIIMVATAYSPQEPGLSDTTATGLKAQKGVVAVDPSFIPLGTRVYVEGYGYAIAADTGGAIKGNKIDLCYDTLAEALAFGRRKVKVRILD